MKSLFLFVIFTLTSLNVGAQAPAKVLCKSGYVQFFSKTPLEDIKAETNTAIAIFEPQNGKLRVRIQISTFTFPNHLMQEHFNENYLESEKYPLSQFEGIASAIDWVKLKDGVPQQVNIKGDLEIHGVKKAYSVAGTFKMLGDGKFQGEAKFPVRIADHGIKIPAIVFKNIAEVVDVTIRFQGGAEVAK
jgi:polyisoprenoid-binding protein YceI